MVDLIFSPLSYVIFPEGDDARGCVTSVDRAVVACNAL